jgi:hypothetical protein
MEKLILLERKNKNNNRSLPSDFEIHRGEIKQRQNLVLTTRDKEFAEKLVESYNKPD